MDIEINNLNDATNWLNFKIKQLQVEIDLLKSAIATPEVYAGVITKVVEDERDKALKENEKLNVRLNNFKIILGHLDAELKKMYPKVWARVWEIYDCLLKDK